MPERRTMKTQTYEHISIGQMLKRQKISCNSGPSSHVNARNNLPFSCSQIVQHNFQNQAPKPAASRGNQAINRNQVRNLLLALQFAIALGLAPNRFQTINLQQGGRSGKAAAAALQLMLKTQRDWVRSRGGDFAAIWVREIGPVVGEHVHLLLHVPAPLQREFMLKMRHWRRIVGPHRAKGLIKTLKIWQLHRGGSVRFDGDQNLRAILNYMLKGHDQSSQLQNPHLKRKDCGTVEGKRCGCTQNLGPAARLRYGRKSL